EGKDVGGEILNTELIEDYPGFESVTGTDLSAKMADHARKFGLRIETYAPVKKIRIEGDRKIVEVEDGTTHTAYAVLVTVGGRPSSTAAACRTAPCAMARSSKVPIWPSSAAVTARSRKACSSRASRRRCI